MKKVREMSKKPKPKYRVCHGDFFEDFFEWDKVKAENKFSFWKNYYDSNNNVVQFYEDGKLKKIVTYKVEVIVEEF